MQCVGRERGKGGKNESMKQPERKNKKRLLVVFSAISSCRCYCMAALSQSRLGWNRAHHHSATNDERAHCFSVYLCGGFIAFLCAEVFFVDKAQSGGKKCLSVSFRYLYLRCLLVCPVTPMKLWFCQSKQAKFAERVHPQIIHKFKTFVRCNGTVPKRPTRSHVQLIRCRDSHSPTRLMQTQKRM